MPDEKFFSFWSTNRSSSAKPTISSNRSSSSSSRQAEQRAVDADVVARGQLRVEADAELDERREHAVDANASRVRAVDAGEDLQQRALAAAVRPDDRRRTRRARSTNETSSSACWCSYVVRAERVEEVLLERGPVAGAAAGSSSRRPTTSIARARHQTRSANHGSSRWKSQQRRTTNARTRSRSGRARPSRCPNDSATVIRFGAQIRVEDRPRGCPGAPGRTG